MINKDNYQQRVKILTDKEKIKIFLDTIDVSRNAFYTKTGLSSGFLESGKSFSLDSFRVILDNYPDLNPLWVLLDQSPMIHQPEKTVDNLLHKNTDQYFRFREEFNSFKNETEMALSIILEELDSIDGKKLREKIDLAIKKSDEQKKKGA